MRHEVKDSLNNVAMALCEKRVKQRNEEVEFN